MELKSHDGDRIYNHIDGGRISNHITISNSLLLVYNHDRGDGCLDFSVCTHDFFCLQFHGLILEAGKLPWSFVCWAHQLHSNAFVDAHQTSSKQVF